MERDELRLLLKSAGKQIEAWRLERGITQRQLSQRLGYPSTRYTFISMVEHGIRIPPDEWKDWAEALEQDSDQFIVWCMKHYEPDIFKAVGSSASN